MPHVVPLDGHAVAPFEVETQTPLPALSVPQHLENRSPQFVFPHGSPGGAHSDSKKFVCASLQLELLGFAAHGAQKAGGELLAQRVAMMATHLVWFASDPPGTHAGQTGSTVARTAAQVSDRAAQYLYPGSESAPQQTCDVTSQL